MKLLKKYSSELFIIFMFLLIWFVLGFKAFIGALIMYALLYIKVNWIYLNE